MIVYLAGPVDMPHDHILDVDWRRSAAASLAQSGFTVFNPMAGWTTRSLPVHARAINRTALEFSSAMLVGFPSGNYGFETIREIEFARMKDVPVYAFGVRPHSVGIQDLDWCEGELAAIDLLVKRVRDEEQH